MAKTRSERGRNKKKRWLYWIGGMLLIFILAAGGYAYYLYDKVADTAGDMHEPLKKEKSDKRAEDVVVEQKDPISVLLLGVDERAGDRGRSDTMIVLTVNPQKNSMMMFNIPRDTRTKIVGKNSQDKINHAYAFGGVDMSVDTVENFLDIPIDYYVKVNMEGFHDIVEAVDGVTVDNKIKWTDTGYYKKGHTYEKGEITLETGDEALGYVRMRKQDPRGDMGRNERQRQVIQGIIKKGASLSGVMNFGEIMEVLGGNVKTNLTFDEMKDLQKHYAESRKNMKSFEIDGHGETIDGIWYYIVPDEERESVSEKVKEHLRQE
ncbi:LytR family transcriptional regulator [Bacillus marinisedimentorum]|uniref:polyisoprenyl-teichoic acid--peptidoglycan teichoic acid transferase TagU n=1 Tax=Bacillus marinisedimentorum TaxID=1821260 RepID=UPI0007E08B1A|nr:LytR family transcriptional regulator [Bacillus marinisedimentorum]